MQEKPQPKAPHHVPHALQAPILMQVTQPVVLVREVHIQALREPHLVILALRVNTHLKARPLAVTVLQAPIQLSLRLHVLNAQEEPILTQQPLLLAKFAQQVIILMQARLHVLNALLGLIQVEEEQLPVLAVPQARILHL